jgi:hypothetical protein
MSVIPATWEAEIRKIGVWGYTRPKKKLVNPISTNKPRMVAYVYNLSYLGAQVGGS